VDELDPALGDRLPDPEPRHQFQFTTRPSSIVDVPTYS
jgi:hypothetical protein